MNRIIYIAGITSIIFSLFLICLFIYWSVLDGVYINPVLSRNNFHYTTDKQFYSPGETVYGIRQEFCKYRNVPSIFYTTLIDGTTINYEARQQSIPVGCYKNGDQFEIRQIPLNAPPGKYYFKGSFAYNINLIRNNSNALTYEFDTEPFFVVANYTIGEIK